MSASKEESYFYSSLGKMRFVSDSFGWHNIATDLDYTWFCLGASWS